jgi:hypothetical protein
VANKNGLSIVSTKHGINFPACRLVIQHFEIHQFFALSAIGRQLRLQATGGSARRPGHEQNLSLRASRRQKKTRYPKQNSNFKPIKSMDYMLLI